MSLEESSVLMDRALVTMCADLPESLGLYNTAKDQLSLAALRSVPLLEHVGPESRKLVLLRDWMRAYEPAQDQPLSAEISMNSLKETAKRDRKEQERLLQEKEHAQRTSEGAAGSKEDDRKRRKRQRKKQRAAAREDTKKQFGKPDGRTKAKDKAKSKKATSKDKKATKTRTRTAGRKRHVQLDSDDDVLSIEESISSSEESSSSSSSSSSGDSDGGKKKSKKASGNLPPKEVVLSSDEDDEPNDMFDTADPDVYEVEKIIRKKTGETFGDPDLYEVKWEGYDETTWEPAGNISKDLIDEFEGQPVREDVYTVEEIVDRRSKRDSTTRLRTHQYKVKWVGYDDLTWEPADNLPHNLRRKFDQKYESRKRRRS